MEQKTLRTTHMINTLIQPSTRPVQRMYKDLMKDGTNAEDIETQQSHLCRNEKGQNAPHSQTKLFNHLPSIKSRDRPPK